MGQIEAGARELQALKNSSLEGGANSSSSSGDYSVGSTPFSARQATDNLNITQNGENVNGKKVYPTVVIRQYENGQTILHEITNINRTATYLGRNDFSLSGGSSSSNNQSVPQNGENVQNNITRLADLGYDISKDMGDNTKKALDKAANIANKHRLGGTLDPQYDGDISKEDLDAIWGKSEETAPVRPKYNEAEAMQKLNEVLEGQKPFTDYMNEQRELMWQSFKDSNRGTESFLHKDENGNFDRCNTVSNNGSLYRQLYEEYGGRPTKTEFNEALNDVLANGQNSKYYDGFREFDHDGERSVFGFNQGNEDIDTILDLKDEAPEPSKAEIGAEKPIEPLEPVQPVGPLEPVESAATKTDGRSYEKETESLPEDFDVKHYVTDQVEAQNQSSKTCALRAGIKTNKKAKLLATTLQT